MLTVKKDTRIKPKLNVDSIKRHDLVCNMNTFTKQTKNSHSHSRNHRSCDKRSQYPGPNRCPQPKVTYTY